ncbi:MAG: patatin-like phospholipase family protein, partial [bacterium]|nr:patatin-like phospholipase family protein [bacterium]
MVFAGGGCRTFWSLGVFDRIEGLLPEVREWAGVSAGAAMAATSCVGLGAKTIETFKTLAEANEKNAYFSNLFRRQPVFPHEKIYRTAIQEVFQGDAFDALKAGAPVRILLAYVNAGAPRVRSVFGAMRAYRTRKNNHIVHSPEKPLPGLGAFTLTAQHCRSLDELGDVILASSATPPMTSAPSVNGCTHIDGGFVENAPVRALSDEARAGKVIVLLTRPIPED